MCYMFASLVRDCSMTNCRLYALKSNLSGGQLVDQLGKFSDESEHDLANMVRDFLENSSGGADSICSSDSDSCFSDLNHLSDKVLIYKHEGGQDEKDLLLVVNNIMMSIKEMDLLCPRPDSCNASCIRFYLAECLRDLGYDAGVCVSKWHGSSKVIAGGHQYVDVVTHNERLIIDTDFRSHFEIARPVDSYDKIFNSLPVIYIGNLSKLKHFLHVMVEAAESSLRQNSMPLPPWRSLAYLQAKWESPYQRLLHSGEANHNENHSISPKQHRQCYKHLRGLQTSLQSDMETGHVFKPIGNDLEKMWKASLRSNKHTRYVYNGVQRDFSQEMGQFLKPVDSDPSSGMKLGRGIRGHPTLN